MPTLVLFITLATTLAVMLACIVLLPWLRGNKSAQSNQLMAINIDVFKARLTELEEDYAQAKISQPAFHAQKVELERQLLQANAEQQLEATSALQANNQANNQVDSDDSDSDSDSETQPIHHTATKHGMSSSRKARLTMLIWIPLLIAMGYVLASDRAPVRALWQAQDNVGQVADDLLTGKIDLPPKWATEDGIGLLNALQTNVHHHAHDPKRWMHLADVFLALDANERALEALARAYRLSPTDETVAVRYAQTKFFTSQGTLDTESRSALQTVLQQNPNHQGAQMLMAMGEARAGNYEQAQAWIERLRRGIVAKEGDHSAALQSLEELSNNIATQQQASLQQATAQAPSGQAVQVTVKVNPAIMPLITTGDVLFVTVKAQAGGPPMAVKRLEATQLLQDPTQGLKLVLSDGDAMIPTHTISTARQAGTPLVVTARVSKTGQALSASGDLSANTVPLESTAQNGMTDSTKNNTPQLAVTVEINQQVP